MRKLFFLCAVCACTLNGMAVNAPTGALSGLFKINDAGDQVWFSRGNLQYQASTNTFQFATNQYDAIGAGNTNISASYSGWIDLFGYGTSGYNSINPYKSEMSFSGYGNGETNIAGTEYDWGVHNKISNGGNQVNLWRTLTSDEWYYIFAHHLRYQATVNGTTGMIILPDDFENPGITLQYSQGKFTENVLSKTQWGQLESAGAIFLPADGMRAGTDISEAGEAGYYWTSTTKSGSSTYAVYVLFVEGNAYYSSSYSQPMAMGYCVRLVADRKIADYGVSVNGTALTELNYTDPLGDGSVTFSPSSRELTLTNANIYGLYEAQNVISTDEAITLKLVGTNAISTTSGSGLNLAAGSTINGTGELVISATQGASRNALNFGSNLGIAGDKAHNENIIYITAITNQTLSPAFSVATNNTVQFTKSNLQYNAKFDLFRFAETAYAVDDQVNDDLLGKWISTMSYQSDVWLEMAIYNDGNQSGKWRLLTAAEWQYLLFQRDNALYKFSYGSVGDVFGLIILPDNWNLPSDLSFTVYPLLPSELSNTDNHYSAADWAKMENAGAIFLPYYGNTAACALWLADEIDENNVRYLFAKWGRNPDLTASSLKTDWNHNVRFVVGAYAEGIENVQSDEKATKRIVNGQLIIEKNGKTYNAQGAEIR